MGDFVGGTLKYLRDHPVARVTIAGGPAKMTKLAQGRLDLHSKRGAVDLAALGDLVAQAGGAAARWPKRSRTPTAGCTPSNSPQRAGFDLPALVADGAWRTAARVLAGAPTELEIVVVGRDGRGAREQRIQEGVGARAMPNDIPPTRFPTSVPRTRRNPTRS